MPKKVEYKFDPFELAGISRRGLTKRAQGEILKEVAEFILDKTGQFMDNSNSPVSGQRGFKKLKDGSTSILEDRGDMRDGIRVRREGNRLVHTVVEGQQGKADNHNKFTDASQDTPVPKRQFIPNAEEGQTYKRQIISEMKEVMLDFIKDISG